MKNVQGLFMLVLLLACGDASVSRGLPGTWKILRIELLRDEEVQKIISADNQYWRIGGNNRQIDIYTDSLRKNTLTVKLNRKRIEVLDPVTGQLRDTYEISKLGKSDLELASRYSNASGHYTVHYYLARQPDTTDEHP